MTQGPGAFPAHGNIPDHGEIFRGQQQQHSLVPIMHMGVGLSDETRTERRHGHTDQYIYPPQPVGSYYQSNEHHGGPLPDQTLDSQGHPGYHLQHEYRQPAEHQQHHLQHVTHAQITDQIYQEHRQTGYLDRAGYEASYHGQSQKHVGMAGASPRTTSATSGSAHDSGSPLSASSSGGIPVYQSHHDHAVIVPGAIHLDTRLETEVRPPGAGGGPLSSTSSSSVSSIAVLQPYGGQRPAEGGDLQPSRSGLIGMDVEQVQHMDIGNAAVHRGNGHGGLSVNTSLASLGSATSRLGPSPSLYAGVASEGGAHREAAEQTGYSASMDMGMH